MHRGEFAMTRTIHPSTLALLLAGALAASGCGRQDDMHPSGVKQTGFPGQLTAGGGSSGSVLSQAKVVSRSTAPAGTPGIPQGSGGNTSGAAMGGTTPGPQQAAEREKQSLADSMDALAARWHSRAAANGWRQSAPVPVNASQGFDASANQSGPSGQPGGRLGPEAGRAPVRSEKSGTAPPSLDVKLTVRPEEPPGVKSRAPERAN
jgi:hypothetical protein